MAMTLTSNQYGAIMFIEHAVHTAHAVYERQVWDLQSYYEGMTPGIYNAKTIEDVPKFAFEGRMCHRRVYGKAHPVSLSLDNSPCIEYVQRTDTSIYIYMFIMNCILFQCVQSIIAYVTLHDIQ